MGGGAVSSSVCVCEGSLTCYQSADFETDQHYIRKKKLFTDMLLIMLCCVELGSRKF